MFPLPGTGFEVIRFCCEKCQREYLLADALAHLPLLCKGCGERLTVPDPEKEPPPAPKLPLPVPPKPKDDFLSAETITKLEVPPAPPKPIPPVVEEEPESDEAKPNRKTLAIAVDAAVVVVLLAIGMFVGEMVTGKSTGAVFAGASGPKFPPTDLLLWIGCFGFFALIYFWLGTRGRTVGGWLKRRER